MTVAPVAIVAGAGIGGLSAALALRRQGYAVTVLEKTAEFAAAGGGLLLHPNGLAAIDALGDRLGADVRAAGHVTRPADVRTVMDARGAVLAREPIGLQQQRTGRPQTPILRAALRRVLAEHARNAGVGLELGTTVRGYARRGSGVCVGLAEGATRDADLLVAADGLRSPIRAAMLGASAPAYRGYSSVRGWTPDPPFDPAAIVANGRGLQLFVAPVSGGVYWTAKISAPAGRWPALSRPAARDRLLGALAGWHAPLRELVAGTRLDDLVVTDVHDRPPVRRWTDGPVALLGDAAHPMVPALGQGANQAVEDAVVLGQALGSGLRPAAALREYARIRAPRTADVVLRSRRQGEVDQGRGWLRARLRDGWTRRQGRKDAATDDIVGWLPAPAAEARR
ncbi:FAD-dependent monooxygenase [Mangrovihabitans endophyticus]|uniref:Salicylate hydroxylase n=1 Tax=Mangrovihabitans endophyticus TaxID=1751298 RepID=A0A8J3BW31_9ACTN|nr:FAD-dependent monooxygenase [Mangrovihabitans endophyticus]GGK74041.1 salicylate hydroxylase [Mangrovihabitans endophyticus]